MQLTEKCILVFPTEEQNWSGLEHRSPPCFPAYYLHNNTSPNFSGMRLPLHFPISVYWCSGRLVIKFSPVYVFWRRANHSKLSMDVYLRSDTVGLIGVNATLTIRFF